MDHKQIDNEQVLDLYLMGRLDAAREEELEAHLLHCARCATELELRRGFIDGVRTLEPHEFTGEARGVGATARWRTLALAASVLLAVTTLLSAWSLNEVARLRGTALPGTPPDGTPIVVMTLEQVRGGAAAPNIVEIGAAARLYVLQLDADWQPGQRYEALLRADGGEPLLRQSLLPDHRGMLVIAVPSARLQPGAYTLEVGAADGAGSHQRFGLEVVRAEERGSQGQ